jgi:hypothetical protein
MAATANAMTGMGPTFDIRPKPQNKKNTQPTTVRRTG